MATDFTINLDREEKDKLQKQIFPNGPDIQLDDSQWKLILSDVKYTIMNAPTRTGKTTAAAAKVLYLVNHDNIPADQILVTTYWNNTLENLRKLIEENDREGHCKNCCMKTMHSLGKDIVDNYGLRGKQGAAENLTLTISILNTLRELLKNDSMANAVFTFFSEYFDVKDEVDPKKVFEEEIPDHDYSKEIQEFKGNPQYVNYVSDLESFCGELLRSKQEVTIANYLYLHGIDYEYEPVYPYYPPDSRKPYTPDFLFTIDGEEYYLEHFGFESKDNRSYNDTVESKIKFHEKHGTRLIYTLPPNEENGEIISQIENKIPQIKAQMRSDDEIKSQMIRNEQDRILMPLADLITQFIKNMKDEGLGIEALNKKAHATQNVRSRLFLRICEKCLIQYNAWLEEHECIPFEDIFNEAALILRSKSRDFNLNYQYIIIDEYQDMTKGAFEFLMAFREYTDAKLVAVGDDLLSVGIKNNIGSSSITDYFWSIGKEEDVNVIPPESIPNYRVNEKIMYIAKKYLLRGEEPRKNCAENPDYKFDIILYDEDKSETGLAAAVNGYLDRLASERGERSNVLLLGRTEDDIRPLTESGMFDYIEEKKSKNVTCFDHKDLSVTFRTIEHTKEFSCLYVCVLNGRSGQNGFPSDKPVDPVMTLLDDNSEARERQLFYTAMTRAEKQIIIFAPYKDPSEFLIELKRENRDDIKTFRVTDSGLMNVEDGWYDETEPNKEPLCPICGHKMQKQKVRSHDLGIQDHLYLCTNKQDECGFMTNDYEGVSLAIRSCPQCHDGYLIVKKDDESPDDSWFLRCSNYKKDRTGCNYESTEKYERYEEQ